VPLGAANLVNVPEIPQIAEGKAFELRVDAINVLNHANFGNPSTAINSSNNFGRITTAGGARSFVLNTRISF
jgi:hypothetical protein